MYVVDVEDDPYAIFHKDPCDVSVHDCDGIFHEDHKISIGVEH